MGFDRRSVAIGMLALLAAAGAGVAAGVVLDGQRKAAGRARSPAASATAANASSPVPSPVTSPPRSGPTVPVYVLGDTEAGPRLYREFRPAGGAAETDRVRAAVAGLADQPDDPDYRTPWRAVRVARLARSGADVTVAFAGAPRLAAPAEAFVAVQQVVHTVTAADNAVQRVRVMAPGLPAALTRTPVGRAPQVDVLAPVWLLSPADGSRTGRPVVIRGTASVFEATVSVEARQGSAVAARATATASVGGPGRGTWAATVSLPPGEYVLAAYEVSGKDGSRLSVDTKRITVD